MEYKRLGGRIVAWVAIISFLFVNTGIAQVLEKDTLRPPSMALGGAGLILGSLQNGLADITHGALIFDVDKTLSDKNALFDPAMRDTLIRLLQQGVKIVITTGQAIQLQHGRVVEDVLYDEKVGEDGSVDFSSIKEDRRYRPVPASLLKNLVIYANEGTQRYTYNEDGALVEDLAYRRGLFTRAAVERRSAETGSSLTDNEKLERDREVKAAVSDIIREVIDEIRGSGSAAGLRKIYKTEGIIADIKSDIEKLKAIPEEDRTQEQAKALEDMRSILKDILGSDENLSDIIDKVGEPLKIIDRDTQLAFKYSFEGDDAMKKLKRQLIARLIKRRLAQNGFEGLRVTVSGGTTIGVIQEGVDKEVAVRDLLEKENLEPSEAIYFGDEFTPGGNDMAVTAIPELNVISVNADAGTTPEGVMWAGSGPEAARATLGWILQELEEIRESSPAQAEPVIKAVRRQIRVHTRGGYFFTREALSSPGHEIDEALLKNLNRMLREGFKINVISRKSISSEEGSFISRIEPALRRNLIVYCRQRNGEFWAYRFDDKGERHADESNLRDKAEVVKTRLAELNAEADEAIYIGDSFLRGSDKIVATHPALAGRLNIINISSGTHAFVENMAITGKGPATTGEIVGWIVNDFLFNMKKFPLHHQRPIVELVAKRVFAEDSIRILRDMSSKNAEDRLRPLLTSGSKHYLVDIVGEKGIVPLRDFMDAAKRGEQYHDKVAVIDNIRGRMTESLKLITDRAYRDLLAIYNYDYESLNAAIDRLVAETGLDWNEALRVGVDMNDNNPYRQRLVKTRGGEVTDVPQVLLMVGGTGGNFLAGTLPFSEILSLKSKGFRIAIGVTPHDDGGSSRKAQDELHPFIGYIPSPGDTINVYSGLVSSGKKKVLRWRFGKDQNGTLRSNMLTILNRVTNLTRKIYITGCHNEAKVFDLANGFFKVTYSDGVYRFIDISTEREVAAVEMGEAERSSEEFLLAGSNFKIIRAEDEEFLVNTSIQLDVDWPFFCNAMLRIAQFMDDNILTKSGLSIKSGSGGNFVIIGNNIESGAYKIKTRKKGGSIELVPLTDRQLQRAGVKPSEYSMALQRLSEALGVTNGYAVPSTLDKGTLYVKLSRVAMLGITPDGEPVFIDPEGALPGSLRAHNDRMVSFSRSGDGDTVVAVGRKKAIFAEHNMKEIYTSGKRQSGSTVSLPLTTRERLVLGQGGDVRITATPGKNSISIIIEKRDPLSGKPLHSEFTIGYGQSQEVFYPKKGKTPPAGTASFKIERDDSGRLRAQVTLDRRGQGTMVKIGDVEITFKQRLVIEQTNITESLHLCPIRDVGFVDGAAPRHNTDFVRLIDEVEDAIVMGPGSLTTSLMPILLVKKNVEALRKRRKEGLPTLFVVNPYRDNETVGYSVMDIIGYVERVTGERFEDMFSHILINKPLDSGLIREELQALKAARDGAAENRRAEYDADIRAKEAELKKAEEMLPLYDEMDTTLREHPEKFTSRDPADFSGLAKLSRGAIEASDEEVMELGRRGITVYRTSAADIVESEVRQAGQAGVKKSVGYNSASIARIIDEILFQNAPALDDRWEKLLAAFDGREEELRRWVEIFVKKTGVTHLQAIEELAEQIAMEESEVDELPELFVMNANYTLIRGMDTKMSDETARNIAAYLENGGKIIIQSGIGLGQMMEWIIEPLSRVLGDKKALLGNILLAPYGGIKAFRFNEDGSLDAAPLYNTASKRLTPEMMARFEKEVRDAWSLMIGALGITDTQKPYFTVLDGAQKIEMPAFEARKDTDYRGVPHSADADTPVYFAFRMGYKGELWLATHGITPPEQEGMMALSDLSETAALDIFRGLAKQREIQIFFKNRYGIDDFSETGRSDMIKAMLYMCRTGRVGRYNLKAIIGKYLIYRLEEAGIGKEVSATYDKTANDVNAYPTYSSAELLESLLSNDDIRRNFIGDSIIGNNGRGVVFIGRKAIDSLKLLPEARVFVFDTMAYTVAATGYTEEALPSNVAFYNGPFGSKGFTQLLGKMLDAAELPNGIRTAPTGYSTPESPQVVTEEAAKMLAQIRYYTGLPLKTNPNEIDYLKDRRGLFSGWDDVFEYLATLEFTDPVYQIRDVARADGVKVFASHTREDGIAGVVSSVDDVRQGAKVSDMLSGSTTIRAMADDMSQPGALNKAEIRPLSALSVAMVGEDAIAQAEADSAPAYFMQRGVFADREHIRLAFESPLKQRFDITIMRPGVIGREHELIHTSGHFHNPKWKPEIYQVVYGKAAYMLQRTDEPLDTDSVENPANIKDAIMVEAAAGEPVVILPGYGHVTTNLDPKRPLIMVNWLTWDQTSQYASTYKRGSRNENGRLIGVGGASWYAALDDDGKLSYKSNPNYGSERGRYQHIPNLEIVRPAESVPLLGLKKGEPIYNIVKDRDKFIQLARYLNNPLGGGFEEITPERVFQHEGTMLFIDTSPGFRTAPTGDIDNKTLEMNFSECADALTSTIGQVFSQQSGRKKSAADEAKEKASERMTEEKLIPIMDRLIALSGHERITGPQDLTEGDMVYYEGGVVPLEKVGVVSHAGIIKYADGRNGNPRATFLAEGFKAGRYFKLTMPDDVNITQEKASGNKSATPRTSSTGTLNLDDINALTPQALDRAITIAASEALPQSEAVRKILTDSKLAAQISRLGVSGTIVFNDEALSDEQRKILLSILGKNTPSLRELERVMNSTIRLKSEFSPDDIKGELIIISDTKLEGYQHAKYLMFEQVAELDNSYIPVVPMIAMAKGLLNLKESTQQHLIDSIKQLSRSLSRKPLSDEIIEGYITDGIFNLELPRPETYDYNRLEELQRTALAALIAA